ncbi:hypothetical protein HPY31_21605 [Brevibacillus sp. HB1.3]|uniref:hypothetical protein n=1 Tax=Brevibacillus sp. HB1.3 TaxID=2738842 RepID=UPI00155240CE|nr:hypothetical protein [Brevibacillus sp. HB1.3]NQF16475.1 hypothetical protein [Brevibacillus sp. HB1.3]
MILTVLAITTSAFAGKANYYDKAFFNVKANFSNNEVANLKFYDGSALSKDGLTNAVINARHQLDWNVPNANIGFTKSEQNLANIRVYSLDIADQYFGLARPFQWEPNGRVVAVGVYDEWDVVKIDLNTEAMKTYKLNETAKQHVTLHEHGHAVGLMHNYDPSVMAEPVMSDGKIINLTQTTWNEIDLTNLSWRY